MNSLYVEGGYELFCVIVNFGLGSKVLKIIKHNGIPGGTITLGRGTVSNRILEFFELTDIRKEIVFLVAEKEKAYNVLDVLYKELAMEKPHHGIAFTSSLTSQAGQSVSENSEPSERGVDNMYNAVFVVVDRGQAEEVVDAAKAAGSKGATIINARGSGIHETATVFNMAIEPEKEIVLILLKKDILDTVIESIRENIGIDKPGHGILFVLDVNRTYGLFD